MRHLVLGFVALFALACDGHGHSHSDGGAHGEVDHDAHGDEHAVGLEEEVGHDELGGGHDHAVGAIAVTLFTNKTEMFTEYPPLVAGEPSRFAAHLSWLKDFSPVAEGKVTVTLSGGDMADEAFSVDEPSQAGIFRPVVTPARAGTRQMVLTHTLGEDVIAHDMGEVTVYASANQVPHEEEAEDPEEISYLLEQRWRLPFASAPVVEASLREAVPAFGQVVAPTDGVAVVRAPVAGRVAPLGSSSRLGAWVHQGGSLVALASRPGGDADRARLQLDVEKARLDLEYAAKDRARLEQMLAEGVIAPPRVDEARKAEAEAEVAVNAAEDRLGRLNVSDAPSGGASITVASPLSGRVDAVLAPPGTWVEAGDPLLKIVAPNSLWLRVDLPESAATRLSDVGGAWLTIPGSNEVVKVDADTLVHRGAAVDETRRTIPLIFQLPEGTDLTPGMSVRAGLYVGTTKTGVAVPTRAIVQEGGGPVVYVQVGGEAYARRQVRLGPRDGDLIAVVDGLSPGERVVTEGAFAVRLAANTLAPPAHGHAH